MRILKKDKKLYINTIGCQMNVYDSEKIVSDLAGLGYKKTFSIESADLIILNTCTIRDKAEQKAFSFLGRLSKQKQRNPRLIVAVGGCVAQQEGKKLIKRAPVVDIVFGTHAIARLPEHIERIERQRRRIIDVKMAESIDETLSSGKSSLTPGFDRGVTAFVTIMQGCENYCTYCVVPYVRGKEISRHPDHIVEEINNLVKEGVREVTLLGQNVNSYGIKQGFCSFAQLIHEISAINGLSRIRFTTSHPKDLSEELMEAFASSDKLCNHIHLPVQSGSQRILKLMNRRYTRNAYLDMIDKLRKIQPDIAISTDIIVGFPGETREDFQQTLELIREVEYDSLFAFKYSDRPQVPAAGFAGKVSEQEKMLRLQQVLALQEELTMKKYGALIGSIQKVLVEGFSKKHQSGEKQNHDKQLTGRTSGNLVVNFSLNTGFENDHHENLTGSIVDVMIKKAYAHSLWGKTVYINPESKGLKGDKNYAA
ncbi:MAG: tRNA (N6-isopentenyl adenosine(37)-C2)-methylthiotransferase MiaB [Desulfobacterales bacterium]